MVVIQSEDKKYGKAMEALKFMKKGLMCIEALLSEGEMDERRHEEYEDDDDEDYDFMGYRRGDKMNYRRGGGRGMR